MFERKSFPKDMVTTIRLTMTEHKALMLLARQRDMSMSDVIRDLVRKSWPRR